MLNKLSREEMIKGFIGDYTKIKDVFKEMLRSHEFIWQKDWERHHMFGREGVWFSYASNVTIRIRWGRATPSAVIYVDNEFFDTMSKFFDSHEVVNGFEYPNFDYDLLNRGELLKKNSEKQEKDTTGDIKMIRTEHYLEIVLTKRTDDYHACIRGHHEIWGCGENYNEAIGDLVRSHKREFGIMTVQKRNTVFVLSNVPIADFRNL